LESSDETMESGAKGSTNRRVVKVKVQLHLKLIVKEIQNSFDIADNNVCNV